jgi:ubiquinol-cytochrome c reductase cytochrome c subunit
VTALAARRRHPLAGGILVLLGLIVTGVLYALVVPAPAGAAGVTSDDIAAGRALFLANCSTCHGANAEGRVNAPSLIGVGAAAVDFQVGTGRMPLAASGPQAPRTPVKLTTQQVTQLAAYVASLAPGPAVPAGEDVDAGKGDPAHGGKLFITNCAMCHNSAGKGGELTYGKYAPSVDDTPGRYVYEAMVSGPQSMPVFTDATISKADKRDIIAYLATIRSAPAPGGWNLGGLGPVSEGLIGWLVGLGLLVGCAVWLGAKSP